MRALCLGTSHDRSGWCARAQERRVEVVGFHHATQVEEPACAQQVARSDGFVVAVEAEEEQTLLRVLEHAALRYALLHIAKSLEEGPKLSERDRPHLRHESPDIALDQATAIEEEGRHLPPLLDDAFR